MGGAVLPTLPNGGRKAGVTPEMVAPPRGPGNNRGWGQVRNQVMRPGIDYPDPNYDENGNRLDGSDTVPLSSVPGYPYEQAGMAYGRGPRSAPMPVRASAQPVGWSRYFG
jgi:hypothetical protein